MKNHYTYHSAKLYQKQRNNRRHVQKRAVHRVKLREQVGVLDRKQSLNLALLNVDGLSSSTFEDVHSVIQQKSLDLCILLETKRREEEIGSDISIPGYTLKEIRRSDAAEDKAGGGIAYYTKQQDGLIFKEHSPPIANPTLHYVRNERFWVTIDSLMMKTAICGVYLGCQHPDDRHGQWNDGLLQVLQDESAALRAKGYRVVMLGDFNSHVGSEVGVGVPGNNPDINLNGERFLNFLNIGSFRHINGDNSLTTGKWTRQRGLSKSILDYAVISSEHMRTVQHLLIDSNGSLGGGSDHNFLVLTLSDMLAKTRRLLKLQPTKVVWNSFENIDWEPFKSTVSTYLGSRSFNHLSVDDLASHVSSALLTAGEKCIGRKTAKTSKPNVRLPWSLVEELQLKRKLEQTWKSKVALSTTPAEELTACENAFLSQKSRVNDLLFAYKTRNRPKIKELCSGKTANARKNFWSAVNRKVKESSAISAVVNPVTGILKCNIDEIITETEEHLCQVFNGTMENPVSASDGDDANGIPAPAATVDNHIHTYSVPRSPCLPKIDDSASIEKDPAGWANKDFTFSEVKSVIKTLKGGKSSGWDKIPNEFLINTPDIFISWLTVLFNKIKSTGSVPKGWNKGRVTLIHKSGLREVLMNYRPITVIISLSGLFSKLLNTRLSEVVESHSLLGEVQNGFRKERQMADNSFILNSILMKAKHLKQNVHLCYVDISKAYDTVNREILWKRLAALGFHGDFLECLKALYDGDSLVSVVNGISTKPVYPKRGLRQGCSLSPLLFALYISDLGSDIAASLEGFQIGGLTLSGLLFADDIVLISRTFPGLERLVSLVKTNCDHLKLSINQKKSNLVTPDDVDHLVLLDADDYVTLSLSKTLSYNYLGTETTLLMSSTATKRQQRCIKSAKSYKFACFHVAKTGPDVVDTVLATWSNIAIPSILSGCEVIPFSDTTIEAIERMQSQLAKHVLGLPLSAPNICAQTELGLKPFRMILYKKQLNFYTRVMNLPQSRWVHRVLSEHLRGDWVSPYMAYIAKIRQKTQLIVTPTSKTFIKVHLNSWFLNRINFDISNLSIPCVSPMASFSRARYICENDGCQVIASFLFSCAGLGNKAPRPGRQRTSICSLCTGSLDEAHVAFHCPAMNEFREDKTDITRFITMCRTKNIYTNLAYKWYVTGKDWNGCDVSTPDYLSRGHTLRVMVEEWLRRT